MAHIDHRRFRKVAPATVEHRCEYRHSVGISALSSGNEPADKEALLDEISPYGCVIEGSSVFADGAALQLSFFEREPIPAKLVWSADGKLGCRFDEAIDGNLLRALTLRSV